MMNRQGAALDLPDIAALIPTREFVLANYFEAALWIAIGLIVLVRRRGRLGMSLSGALFAFGISDIVETRTGAWYEPGWLLVWKCACVGFILVLTIKLVRRVKQRTD